MTIDLDDTVRSIREQVSLLDFLTAEGVGLTPKSAARSEYAGPCPACGGTDRFYVKVHEGKFGCRGCEAHGDVIDAYQLIHRATFGEAVTALRDQAGIARSHPSGSSRQAARPEPVAAYNYTDEHGKLLWQVVRFEPKDFRQRRPTADGGWTYSLNGTRRVLYGLPGLLRAKPDETVVIVEGERDADRLRREGFTATCHAGGTGNTQKMLPIYRETLAGRHVAILPDHDDPGRDSAQAIAQALHGHAVSVRVISLAGLAPKQDVSDWLDLGHTGDDLRAKIEATKLWSPEEPAPAAHPNAPDSLPEIDPFPLEVLPPVVRDYCATAARSLGAEVPVEMVAAPLLAMVGALAGNRLGLAVKGTDWVEHAGLFVAIIAKPGSAKTAAIAKARRPLARLQALAKEQFEADLATFKQEHHAWSQDRDNPDRGPEPGRPEMRHYFTTDVTIERLAGQLAQNPGVSLIVDELRGWLNGFDKYRAGKGSDRQQYLSMWGSETIKVDRKSGDPVYVPHPVASIVGGLQTDFAGDFQLPQGTDGLTERILPIVLDHGSQSWTEEEVSTRQSDDLFALFQQIDSLDPQQYGLDRITVGLHPEARKLWIAFYNANAERVNQASGLASGMYQKLSNHTARFALILHTLWHPDDPRVLVSAETMAHAIALADWWGGHIERYLWLVGGTPGGEREDAVERRILRILRTRVVGDDADGWVARTDLYNGLRTVRSTDLDAVLAALVAVNKVECRMDMSATKPGTSWRIVQQMTSEDSYFSENLPEPNHAVGDSPNSPNPQNGVHAVAPADASVLVWQQPSPRHAVTAAVGAAPYEEWIL